MTGVEPGGDFNRDGVVDSGDLADYESAKGLTGSSGAPPEGPQGWSDLTEPRIGYAGYMRSAWTSAVSGWVARFRPASRAAQTWSGCVKKLEVSYGGER
ncbi:MAG TPA: hypothetical protein VEB22_08475 [Phycisphaerales bacterium]|nr:hypothetical protein [Phycisphaerales bacterium]